MSVRKRTWSTPSGEARTGWQADYTDAKGKRRRKMFERKKEADAFMLTAASEVREGIHVAETDSVTVEKAGELWIAAKIRAGREAATTGQYRQHLDLHIVPYIGSTKLTSLTVPAIRAFEEKLRDEGRSTSMVRKVLVSLGSLLADAQERGLIARNVVRDMRGRRSAADGRAEKRAKGRLRVGVDIPSPDEIKALVTHLRGRWRPLLLTAIFTGLRASELRGLRWDDVDLEKEKVVHIRQRADRFNQIGRPKSEAGERAVPLTPIVVNTLKEWKLACPRRNDGTDEEPVMVLDLVFPNGQGRVESLANIINRGLIPAQLAAGLAIETGKVDAEGKPILAAKYTGMHALRHFYASWCINSRAAGGLELPPKEVQERMGHATIALTLDTYSHLFPRSDAHDALAEAERTLLGT